MNISIHWPIAVIISFFVIGFLMPFLRKHKFIREPIGKYGWGFIKDDFKFRWIIVIPIVCVLAIIFYFIFHWAVQFA